MEDGGWRRLTSENNRASQMGIIGDVGPDSAVIVVSFAGV